MPKHFKTNQRHLTEDEKRRRAIEYNAFEIEDPINVEDFVKQEIYEETIVLKCLKCGFQEEIDFDYIAETWFESDKDPYPISYCAKCNQPKVVPLDVYNTIKSS